MLIYPLEFIHLAYYIQTIQAYDSIDSSHRGNKFDELVDEVNKLE